MSKETDRSSQGAKGWLLPFLFIFLALAYLSFTVSFPLLKPLAWAVLLSFTVYPLFKRIRVRLLPPGISGNWAAALATGIIVLLLVLPSFFAGFVAAREGVKLYETVADVLAGMESSGEGALAALLPEQIVERMRPWMERYPVLRAGLQQAAAWGATTAVDVSRAILGSTLTFLYYLAVIIVASFFLIRDGHVIVEYLKDIMPLPEAESAAFFIRAKQVLQAVVYGVILTALAQGVAGGLGWWFVDLPSPMFFGALMVFFAMIPFLGTALIWAPGALYLFYMSEMTAGIALLAWGALVVSTVDSLLRPLFISGGGKVHILIVFIGVVGGLAAWGFLGLFMGPLVVTLFVFLLESYRTMWKTWFVLGTRNARFPVKEK